MTNQDVILGQRVKFSTIYSAKASNRYKEEYLGNGKYSIAELSPLKLWNDPKVGFVVGVRSVIMGDFKYKTREEEPGKLTGKRETVLLVCENKYRKPFVVRFQDVEWFGESNLEKYP